jgi:hypothetical protein
MSIYWMKTADVYPDGSDSPNDIMAFDPEVRFPRFHMEMGDETIGNTHLIEGSPESGLWQWSVTVALPGPRYGRPPTGERPAAAMQLVA